MRHAEKRVMLLLMAIAVMGLGGCGGQEEAPVADQTRQTEAMVPDTVVPNDAPPAVETPTEADTPVVAETVPAEDPPPPADVAEAPNKTVVAPPPPAPRAGDGRFSLQLGSYKVEAQAREKADQLKNLGHAATVETAEVNGGFYYRVFIRGLASYDRAEKLGEELQSSLGLGYLVREKVR